MDGTFNKGAIQSIPKGRQDIPWGRVNGTKRKSWSGFNQVSLESAKENIGNFLPSEDHQRVGFLETILA
jgi:hypothetical protein